MSGTQHVEITDITPPKKQPKTGFESNLACSQQLQPHQCSFITVKHFNCHQTNGVSWENVPGQVVKKKKKKFKMAWWGYELL